jgi:hypothetical protein
MPSSFTPSLRFTLQFPGEGINLWGDIQNSGVFTLMDYATAGWLNKTITGDYSLTTANGATDEARAAMLKFNGALAADAAITIPSVSKHYFVFNNTNKTLTFTTGAGSTVAVAAGDKTVVCCDGSSVHTTTFGGFALKDYIDQAILATTGSLPATTGNEDKVLQVQGGAWLPTAINADSAAVRLGTATNRFMTPGDEYNALSEVTLYQNAGTLVTGSAAGTTLDNTLFTNATIVLAANATLPNLTNPVVNKQGRIRFVQDATGSRTLAVGSNWKRSGGALALTTTANAIDILRYDIISSTYIEYTISRNPT